MYLKEYFILQRMIDELFFVAGYFFYCLKLMFAFISEKTYLIN